MSPPRLDPREPRRGIELSALNGPGEPSKTELTSYMIYDPERTHATSHTSLTKSDAFTPQALRPLVHRPEPQVHRPEPQVHRPEPQAPRPHPLAPRPEPLVLVPQPEP